MRSAFDQARQLFVDGVRASAEARWQDAEELFAASLALLPGRASTLLNLAAARLKLGRPQEALEALDALAGAEADAIDAWVARAAALADLGRHEEALPCHERVLALAPGHEVAARERARSLLLLGRAAEAQMALRSVLDARPSDAAAWVLMGQVQQALDDAPRGLASYERALALDPRDPIAWSLRGGVLKDLGRHGEAARCFAEALAHGGDRELNGYLLASVGGGPAPRTAPRQYVEPLFDGYADSFDEHLTGPLEYQAPERLAGLLPAQRRWRAALDLGCGTGLMGPLLAPRCVAVDGVDLSRRMLARAHDRGFYRELLHDDASHWLPVTAARYDLVVAADVFIYVGDLDAMFAGVARVLDPGGWFVFSAEEAAPGRDVELRASSRFAHGEAYLRGLASRSGLDWLGVERGDLRREQHKVIGGLFVKLCRPA